MIPSDVDETLEAGPVEQAVAGLALRKARAVAERVRAGVVLAADTVVVIDGVVLGKPAGPEEAGDMLVRLRGRQHEVITGVAVVDAGTGRAASTTAVSRVLMAAYPDAMIAAYVASGSPLDKAGAYAIQDLDGALVDVLARFARNLMNTGLAVAIESFMRRVEIGRQGDLRDDRLSNGEPHRLKMLEGFGVVSERRA